MPFLYPGSGASFGDGRLHEDAGLRGLVAAGERESYEERRAVQRRLFGLRRIIQPSAAGLVAPGAGGPFQACRHPLRYGNKAKGQPSHFGLRT